MESFGHNFVLSRQIILEFCTEHDSITVVFSASFQNDSTNIMDAVDKRDFARFEFEGCFGRIPYIAPATRSPAT